MMWLLAILIVLVLGGAVAVAAGLGNTAGEEYGDRPDAEVPADRPLRAEDLARVRFGVGLRGYRMDEVDALLARLTDELGAREGTSQPGAAPEPSEPTEPGNGADPGSGAAPDREIDHR